MILVDLGWVLSGERLGTVRKGETNGLGKVLLFYHRLEFDLESLKFLPIRCSMKSKKRE